MREIPTISNCHSKCVESAFGVTAYPELLPHALVLLTGAATLGPVHPITSHAPGGLIEFSILFRTFVTRHVCC